MYILHAVFPYYRYKEEENTMISKDTIYLLRECNAGTQMAVYSLNEVLGNVKDQKLCDILTASRNHHE